MTDKAYALKGLSVGDLLMFYTGDGRQMKVAVVKLTTRQVLTSNHLRFRLKDGGRVGFQNGGYVTYWDDAKHQRALEIQEGRDALRYIGKAIPLDEEIIQALPYLRALRQLFGKVGLPTDVCAACGGSTGPNGPDARSESEPTQETRSEV